MQNPSGNKKFLGFRFKKFLRLMDEQGVDAFLTTSDANIRYLADIPSRDSVLFIHGNKPVYLTDSRYSEEARLWLPKFFVLKEIKGSSIKAISDICTASGTKRLGFESSHITYAYYRKLLKEIKGRTKLIPLNNLIEDLRSVKTEEEIKRIRKATAIALQAMRIIKPLIVPGKKEIEIAAELERILRIEGSAISAFDIIVASGPNSSYPHHLTGERRIRNNEPVLIDIGADFQGYKSDLTRVFFLGKMSPLINRIYNVVLNAQQKAINLIKPGAITSDIDSAARTYIKSEGFGGFFSHSLGHGVGLQVHEQPRLAQNTDTILQQGMVFTVEPAVYLAGKVGIRIEDMAVVTREGAQVISGTLN